MGKQYRPKLLKTRIIRRFNLGHLPDKLYDTRMTDQPIIHALLPHKEKFTRQNAGAVAMVVEDMVKASKFADHITIFGSNLKDAPIISNYRALTPKQAIIFGKNIGLARAYLQSLKASGITPDWVEVHGRCNVAAYLAAARPDLKIVLILHNDPRDMKGAKTVSERKKLAQGLAGVFSVSQYLMDCFNDGLSPEDRAKIIQQVTPHGIDKYSKTLPKKQKCINITGRMVAEKGMLEIAHALAKILPQHPSWRAEFIGARHFSDGGGTPYEKQVAAALAPLGGQASALGFLPLAEVRARQRGAAVAVVPSVWQEPAGRVVLEAMASGCALITTRRGGIPEYAEGRAMIMDQPTAEHFAEALDQLLSDDNLLATYQRKAWDNYPFTLAAAGKALDLGRTSVQQQTR